MGFTINTNITSLQAQKYLNETSDFQSKTINRVTSGLKIVNSGDDAAGLAIANSYRSDEAVLTQGVSNANDGLSTLQTIDAGISNISNLLDRARTLAAQSASDSFTGSRTTLNSEFQSVMEEIDRQAQAIGMNVGGEFADTLSVFIGGGRTSTGSTTGAESVANGSVTVDLSDATVDTASLGLTGYSTTGSAVSGLQSSSDTSVEAILADTTNTTTVEDTTLFYVTAAGCSDSDAITLSVNTNGVATTEELAEAINSAIASAESGGTAAASAFAELNLTASVYTDDDGNEQISFTSSTGAFQVKAGDNMANALLGNFATTSTGETTGASIASTVTSDSSATTPATDTFASAATISVVFDGGDLSSAVTLTLSASAAETVASVVSELSTAISGNTTLSDAGYTVDTSSFATDGTLTFSNASGESFTVTAYGDDNNLLGLGSFAGTGAATSVTNTVAATGAAGTTTVSVKVGDTTYDVDVAYAYGDGGAEMASAFNTAVAALASTDEAAYTALTSAGIVATSSSATSLTFSSSNGTSFSIRESNTAGASILGFSDAYDSDVASTTLNGTSASAADIASLESEGAYQASNGTTTGALFSYSDINTTTADQTVTITAVDSNGNKSSLAVSLTSTTGSDIDAALETINAALQSSNDSTLQQIVAVKDNTNGSEGIRFLSTVSEFEVSLGATTSGEGIYDSTSTTTQGNTYDSAQVGDGSNIDISTQAGAEAAVTALADAVSALGTAQAAVGKGENILSYASSLASTQLTNLAASESAIRDADLATEAANLTQAQISLQAGVAALAQANSAPQSILTLLQG